jgi:hypothetical protein
VDISTTLPALRRHALATAWPVESIDHGAKHYERDPFNVSHDRPDRRSLRHAGTVVCLDKSVSAPVIGQAPLLRFAVPCNAHWLRGALSGAASLRTIPLRRFHPASARALSSQSDLPTGWFRLRPCGFPLERILCDEARVADAIGSERSNRIRRSHGA